MYGQGISREGSVLDLAAEHDVVKKSGAWYTYEGEQLGQGREKAKEFLTANPEVMVEITDRVTKLVMPQPEDEEVEIEGEIADPGFTEADDEPILLDD